MELTVGILKPDDSIEYRNLRLESLKLHPDAFASKYEQEAKRDKLFFEKQIEEGSRKNIMLGAYDGSALIGLCGLVETEEDTFEIIQMYVRRQYTGLRIGHALLEHAKGYLKAYNKTILALTVHADNPRAISTYTRGGFERISQTDNDIRMAFRSFLLQ